MDLSVSSPDEPSLREETEAITFSASALIAMFIYILEGNLHCWEQPLNTSEPALPEENHSATNHRAQIEIHTLHKRVAYRSNEKEISF
jgi:hypothetical protein